MKIYIALFIGILFFTSCSKESDPDSSMDCSIGHRKYQTNNGTELDLTFQEWYLEKNEIGGGSIHLRTSGSIAGNKATIRTYGDGLISDSEIELDNNNEFDLDLTISFTATCVPEGEFTGNTLIMVYGSTDTLKADLTSCILQYDPE